MTRDEVREEYGIRPDGRIAAAGKFEDEMAYAPYFSEYAGDCEVLSVLEDGCGEFVALVEINDDDRRDWPEVGAAMYAVVIEDDQGFVSVELLASETEADYLRGEYADDACDDEDGSAAEK